MTKKTIEQTYQVLDEISHVRKRCGMYAGSTSVETQDAYIYNPDTKRMESRKISIAPALIKIYSEILDNAIDESRRADGMTAIKVTVSDDGTISILDDGRGIPVVIHEDTQKYIAETVFSNLRAGSNFNDEEDQDLIGTNGVGSTLTNILSTSFKIESADGKKQFTQTFRQGMRERGEPKITESTKHFTRITFTPDWEFFKLAGLDEDHKLRMYKKVVDAAATNPQVKFYLNGEQIKVKNFSDYIALHDESFVYDDGKDFKVGVTKFDRLQQISFINSVETYQGGSHVTYITNQIVDALRAVIKKKHKVDVSPGDIRSHMCVFISGRVNRPRFSSQTKENMISPVSEWKTSWTVSDKFIQRLLKTEIIQSILDWAAAKEQAQLNKELRNANKSIDKVDPRRVAKFSDANEKINRHRCVLFLAEGDCIEETTEVLVWGDSEDSRTKQIKDIRPGDFVLTHNNRWKEVTQTAFSVRDTVEIGYQGAVLSVSPKHRLLTYLESTDSFEWVEAQNITTAYQLVENSFIHAIHCPITDIELDNDLYRISFDLLGEEETWDSTGGHTFMVFNLQTLEYSMVAAENLSPDEHVMLMRK